MSKSDVSPNVKESLAPDPDENLLLLSAVLLFIHVECFAQNTSVGLDSNQHLYARMSQVGKKENCVYFCGELSL